MSNDVKCVRFEDYVSGREAALLRYAYLLTGDASRAEDLVQTALLKTYAHWRRIVSRDHPDAYVRKIVTNAHLDWHRKRYNHDGLIAEVPETADTARFADPADRVVVHDELSRALSRLRATERACLVLRYYEAYSDAQSADVLGCSEVSVRSYVSRGLSAMRGLFSELADNDVKELS